MEKNESSKLDTDQRIGGIEEKFLKQALEKLKKENFSLNACINAMQLTLETKLKEFKQVKVVLSDLYKQIWTEREGFSSAADEFNDKCGVLSDWWENQMSFVSDLDKLKQKIIEEKECKEDIEELKEEIKALRKNIQELNEAKQISVKVDVHLTEHQNPLFDRKDERAEPPEKILKQVRFAEADDEIAIAPEVVPSENELFSLMDIEKVKMAKKNHRNCCEKRAKIKKNKKIDL